MRELEIANIIDLLKATLIELMPLPENTTIHADSIEMSVREADPKDWLKMLCTFNARPLHFNTSIHYNDRKITPYYGLAINEEGCTLIVASH